MLQTAPDALRADMRRFYLLDLDDMFCSNRILAWADLAANLPEDARIWARLNPRLGWTTTQQLLANIADATAFNAWTKTDDAYNGGKWQGALTRPGEEAQKRGYSIQQINNMLHAKWIPEKKA